MAGTRVTDDVIRAAQSGDQDAMWTILSAYEPQLRAVVRSVAPNADQSHAEDLLQEARVALIQHVHNYDTSADGAQLSTFAHRGVRRVVAEEWMRMSSAHSVDPTAMLRVRRALLEHDWDREDAWTALVTTSTPDNFISRERFLLCCEALRPVMCLDAPDPDSRDGSSFLRDAIPDPEHCVSAWEKRELARWLLERLAPRQSLALRLFYGIGMQRQSDADAAQTLQVTPNTLRQLRQRGVARAREIAEHYRCAA